MVAKRAATAALQCDVESLQWAGGASGLFYTPLVLPEIWSNLQHMDLIYPINFVGHDEWLDSGYEPKLAHGDVITRDGEDLGSWRVVDYDRENEYSSGQFEFLLDGENLVKFAEGFSMLDVRTSRGLALSNLTKTIREWHENEGKYGQD